MAALQNNMYNKGLNTLGKLGLGALGGLVSAASPAKQQFYVRANYKGNGLADTGIGVLDNSANYRDPIGGMMALGQLWGDEETQADGSTSWKTLGNRAKEMFNSGIGKAKNALGNTQLGSRLSAIGQPRLPRGYAGMDATSGSIPVYNGINANVVNNPYQTGITEQYINNYLRDVNYDDPYYVGNIGRYIGG